MFQINNSHSSRHIFPGLLLVYFFFSCISSLPLGAQPWMEGIPKRENPNFFEMRDAFNTYWEGRTVEKGKGYKPFRRWEWYWETRVDANGNFPPAGLAMQEWQRYLQEKAAEGPAKSLMTTTGNWTSMGPSSSGGGYEGIGRINCIAFHPTNASTIYIGSAGGGLWRSTNGGSSWTALTDQLQVLGVSGIVVDPANTNTIYIATGDGDGSDTYSVGVMKSTDGGVTWVTTGLNWAVTNYRVIRKLIMHPTNNQLMMAVSSDGIWRTVNGGTNWSQVISGNFHDIEFQPGTTSTFHASSVANVSGTTTGRIHRSLDNGATWTLEHSVAGVGRIALGVSASSSTFVAALCANSSDSGFNGFYSSSNAGDSYTLRSSSPNLLGWSTTGSDTGGQGWYDLCVAVDPTNPNTIYTGGVNTWKSTDGGVTWSIKTMWYSVSGIAAVHADKHDLIFQNSTTLFEANDGGIYRTTNGGNTWTDLSNGLVISQVYRLGSAQTNNAVIMGLQDNSSKLRNNAGLWSQALATGDGMESIIDPTNANIMYTASYYGEIRRTTNGGANWTDIQNNISGDPSGAWITPYVLDPNNPQVIFAGYTDLYRSANRGDSWVNLTNGATGGRTIHAIAVAPSNSSVIYLYCTSSAGRQLLKSTNGGTSWATITYPPGPATNISSLTVKQTDANTLWVTMGGYSSGQKIFKSTNGGSSWTNVSGTLPNLPANCAVYQNGSDEALYLGMDVGVFYRNASMTDWVPFNTGLPNVEVFEMDIQYNTGKLRAATYGRGLWESDLYQQTTTCTAPTLAQLTASGITTSAARLNCSVSGVNAYDWRYRPVGTTTWTELASASANFADVSGLIAATNYEFQAMVQCGTTWSAWSPSQTFSTLSVTCTAPASTDLSASLVTYQSARIHCALTGVSGYDWRYRVLGSATWTDIAATATAFADISGLSASTQYEFQASVQCGTTWSAWSPTFRFITAAPPCNPPLTSQLSATAITTISATLNCSTPNVISFDWRYRIQGMANWIDLPATTAAFVQLSALQPATTYEYQVTVQCGINTSDWSDSQTFTTATPPCSTPTLNQLTASNLTTQSATLNCSMTGVDQYDWRYRVQGAANWTDLPATTVGTTNLSGLAAQTNYEFQVAIQCQGAWTSWSVSQSFATQGNCNAPLTSQFTAGSVTSNSASLSCSVTGVTAYDWRYRAQGSSSWIDLPASGNSTTNLTGLSMLTTYEYQVSVQCGGASWSPWSATKSFTTTAPPCPEPQVGQLLATNITAYTAQLNCSMSGVVAYDWRYRVIGASSWTDLASTTQPQVAIANLNSLTNYEFQVSVQCAAGNWSSWSGSQIFQTLEDQCLPPNFAQQSVTNLTPTTARLNTLITNGVNAYDWRYKLNGAANWIDLPTTTVNFYDLTGLTPASQYEFQAAIQCGTTWSLWSWPRRFLTPSTLADDNEGLTFETANDGQLLAGALYALKLQPVPAKDYVDVQIRISEQVSTEEHELQLSDFNGKIVQQFLLGRLEAGIYQHTMELTSLPPGIYFIRLRSAKGQAVERLVKSAW